MPLILETSKQVTLEINAIKVVSTPNDNDLNTTTLYPYEGFYNVDTGEFTALIPLSEHILDESTYVNLMQQAKDYYDANLTDNLMGIYLAQKIIMYDWLATQINETGYSII